MKQAAIIIFVLNILMFIAIGLLIEDHDINPDLQKLKATYSQEHVSSVDHSRLEVLQDSFATAQEVSETCMDCHTERHAEIMKTPHWLWERESFIKGRGVRRVGKKNALNNFCINIHGSEPACMACHAGLGWTDSTFDFNQARNVDCMVCHDNSGLYAKGTAMAGLPDSSVNLTAVAQGVGLPQKDNCGLCHFTSGGGNNVKHGDLETGLLGCSRDVDVHMNAEGLNMACTDCHEAENHQIKGKLYTVSSMNRDRATCEQCHGERPHLNSLVNEHTIKVACQTCHIPTYAKVNATKTYWDWSQAGKLKDGKPYEETDTAGNITYLSKKGQFEWGQNLEPEYAWFNGTADHYLIGDTIPQGVDTLIINPLYGSYTDKNSKIIPVKVHRGKQPYDTKHRVLLTPKLWAKHKGEGGFWEDFNWDASFKAGVALTGIPYSGSYDFIETEMNWPINHMVATRENTLACTDCHNRTDSRLAALTDFYMPGRDYNPTIDLSGKLLIIMTFIGVLIHAVLRIIIGRRHKAKA